MKSTPQDKYEWVNKVLSDFANAVYVPASLHLGYEYSDKQLAKQAIIDHIQSNYISRDEILKLKEEMRMHTVPEGSDLITRSYLENSIDFMLNRKD